MAKRWSPWPNRPLKFSPRRILTGDRMLQMVPLALNQPCRWAHHITAIHHHLLSVTEAEKAGKPKEGETLMDGFQKWRDRDKGVQIKEPAETLQRDVEKHKTSFLFQSH